MRKLNLWGWVPASVAAWRWALPAFVILAIATLWPLGAVLWTSLFRSNVTTPGDKEFVALANYGLLVTDSDWWNALVITLLLTAAIVLTQLLLGAVFAAALRELPLSWPVARIVVLVPAVTLAVVTAVAMQYAVEAGFLATWFGLERSAGGLLAVFVAEVWRGTGFVVAILYFALAKLDLGVVENAYAVGAHWYTRVWRVWLPALGPALAIATMFRVLDTLRVVEAPVLAGGDRRTIPAQIWNDAFANYEQGLAAATSVALLGVVAVVGVLLFRLLGIGRRA